MKENKLAGAIADANAPEMEAVEVVMPSIPPAVQRAVEDVNRRLDALPDSQQGQAEILAAVTMLQRVAQRSPETALAMHVQALKVLGVDLVDSSPSETEN